MHIMMHALIQPYHTNRFTLSDKSPNIFYSISLLFLHYTIPLPLLITTETPNFQIHPDPSFQSKHGRPISPLPESHHRLQEAPSKAQRRRAPPGISLLLETFSKYFSEAYANTTSSSTHCSRPAQERTSPRPTSLVASTSRSV